MTIMYLIYSNLGIFTYGMVFVLGVILGSFINSWVWREHDNVRIYSGRSMCVHCHRQLRWFENIPLFSYFFLKRRCRTCFKSIPSQYFIVELAGGIILTFLAWYHVQMAPSFQAALFFRDMFFATILLCVFISDWRYKIILTHVVWAGVLGGIIFNYYYAGFSLISMGLGALVAGGFFLLQYLVSRGRWIGGGDVRLGIMMGVWLGFPVVIEALFLAYVVGALVAVVLLVTKRVKRGAEIPFGVFLALATFCAMFHGRMVVDWYLSLLR